jgi:hypothetical protein
LGLVQSPRPTPPSNAAGVPACCTALLFLCIPCSSPLRRDTRPQPHAAHWRLPPMRLELTMFMLSLSSTISEVCLTVQKPTVRTYCIGETLPQYSNSTCASAFSESAHALRRTDITPLERPAASRSAIISHLHYTPIALESIVPYLVLCAVYQKAPFPSSILSTCSTSLRSSPLLPSTRPIHNNITAQEIPRHLKRHILRRLATTVT